VAASGDERRAWPCRAGRCRAAPLILNDPSASPKSILNTPAGAAAEPASPFGPSHDKQPPRVGGDDAAVKTVRRDEPKVGRNDPCPAAAEKNTRNVTEQPRENHGIAFAPSSTPASSLP